MPDYTHLNLKELPNAAESAGLAEHLEAGVARKARAREKQGVSHHPKKPGVRPPVGHRHGEQEEVYVVLDGSGRIKLEDEIVELERYDAIRVGASVARAIEAGPAGLELLAIGAPHADDTEMLQGWWP
jgi:mannose-6-phosphate isomerase-like protein (cupin superfamily)